MKQVRPAVALSLVSLVLSLNVADVRAGQLLDTVIVNSSFYCLVDPSCSVTRTETTSTFTLEGVEGEGILHTWTFKASPGSAAEGAYGYEYQLEFPNATEVDGANCINSFRVKLGAPLGTLDYNGDGTFGDEVYWFFTGPGNIISKAERDGPFVTFFFWPGQGPLCPNPNGSISVRFGVLAGGPPITVLGDVNSFKGVVQVSTRAPNLLGKLSFALSQLYDTVATLPPGGFIAPSLNAGEARRRSMLNRVNAALTLVEDDNVLPAVQLLQQLRSLTDGEGADDWVQDDPDTRENEQTNLLEILDELLETLIRES